MPSCVFQLLLLISFFLLCTHARAFAHVLQQQINGEIAAAKQVPLWKSLETAVNDEELVPISLSLNYDAASKRAMELLFLLIANPLNTPPNAAENGLSETLQSFHSRLLHLNVLPLATAASDFSVMNSYPALFPRYFEQLLSKTESASVLLPTKENIQIVEEWLKENGVEIDNECEIVAENRDYYSCKISKRKYERLFPFAVLKWYESTHTSSKFTLKVFPTNLLDGFALYHTASSSSSVSTSSIRSALAYIGGANWWPTEAKASGEAYLNRANLLKHTQQLDDVKLADQLEKHVAESMEFPSRPLTSDSLSSTTPVTFSDIVSILQTSDSLVSGVVRIVCPDLSNVYATQALYCYPYGSSVSAVLSAVSVGWSWTEIVDSSPVVHTHWHNFTNDYQIILFKLSSAFAYYSLYFPSLPLARNYLSYTFTFQQMWRLGNSILTTTLNGTHPISGQQAANVAYVKSLYRWSPSVSSSSSSSSPQAIASIHLSAANPGYYSPSDLNQFLSENSLDTSEANRVAMKGGNNDASKLDAETQLDIQWLLGVSSSVSSVIYHSNVGDPSAFVNVLQLLSAESDNTLPNVISFSYGIDEGSMTQSGYFDQTNLLLQQLASRGISILVSSGDSGCWQYPYCDSGARGCGFDCSAKFMNASYPASSPYVTSVGATQLITPAFDMKNGALADDSSYCPHEVAASIKNGALITTGGGFSRYFARPSYQSQAVAKYLSSCFAAPFTNNSQYFNAAGRAFPDIALLGRAFTIVNNGQNMEVDGTSASAPALAGFISVVNAQRKAAGLGALGFLNIRLYQIAALYPNAFNDIVEGDTSCAGVSTAYGTTDCCNIGFSACVGFDSATGLGSPRFDVLASLLAGTSVHTNWNFSAPYAYMEGCGPAPSSSGLSPSAIIGIVISSILAGLVLIAVVGFCYRRRKFGAQLSQQFVGSGTAGYAPLEGPRAQLPAPSEARFRINNGGNYGEMKEMSSAYHPPNTRQGMATSSN